MADGPDEGFVSRGTVDAAAQKFFGERLILAERYAEALATSGVERGLLGPREVPRVWERHLLNCAAVIELIAPDVRLVDVGSGAGLPGLVIAIARPDVDVTLVEPLLRRVTWLAEVVAGLELANVTVHRSRAEEAARDGLQFDVATARAVATLGQLATWSLPLVRPGGELLALKGALAGVELADATDVLRAHGAVTWDVVVCGEELLSEPTTVVRVGKSTTPARPPSRRRAAGKSRRRR
jgi:16S rRNA (guanine527-N7)-methyltransferase